MTPDTRSRALRAEADEVLDMVALHELCAPIGCIVPTGSYFMDLMMYPDVDLYLPMTTPERLMGVGVQLAKHECVTRMNYMRGGTRELADGLYLKPVVAHGQWGRPWKIDIWSLPASVIDEKQAELTDLKTRMTPSQRAIILDTKRRLLTDEGRTPMFSGVYIYRAVIDHGMETLDDIVAFLKTNAINVSLA